MRRTSAAAVATALAVGAVISTAGMATAAIPQAASSATPTAEVKLGTQPIRLTSNGKVPVAVRIRCSPGVQAFELYVDVTQPQAQGTASAVAPPFVASCNGTWERIALKVSPSTGKFRVGRGTVNISLHAYLPPPEDGDVEAGAGASIWIGPHKK